MILKQIKKKNQTKNQKKLIIFFPVLNWIVSDQNSFKNKLPQKRHTFSLGSYKDLLLSMYFLYEIIESQKTRGIKDYLTVTIPYLDSYGENMFKLDSKIPHVNSIKRGLRILCSQKLIKFTFSKDRKDWKLTPFVSKNMRYYAYFKEFSLQSIIDMDRILGGRVKSQDCFEILFSLLKILSNSPKYFAPDNIVRAIGKDRSYSKSGHVTKLRKGVLKALGLFIRRFNTQVTLLPYSRLIPAREGVSILFKGLLRRPLDKSIEFKKLLKNTLQSLSIDKRLKRPPD